MKRNKGLETDKFWKWFGFDCQTQLAELWSHFWEKKAQLRSNLLPATGSKTETAVLCLFRFTALWKLLCENRPACLSLSCLAEFSNKTLLVFLILDLRWDVNAKVVWPPQNGEWPAAFHLCPCRRMWVGLGEHQSLQWTVHLLVRLEQKSLPSSQTRHCFCMKKSFRTKTWIL